ncbi:DEAD/DEAH box helicase [Marinobacter salarius]|uniref:Ski2-like helicase n=1 Tax=Marinobacter salarius TaxID=1420917 RepID=A0A1W6K6Y8_9GAMM|nr:DEAD/DEAH box helicase [Marinobacter salarius]ARM83161.1 ski2-like helicase [Marinobacter salarius]
MGESLIYKAARHLWDDESFQGNFTHLKLENLRYNLNLTQNLKSEIDFSNLMRAASLFSLVNDEEPEFEKFHESAFRIAYISSKIWLEQPQNFSQIVAIILTRIGNFPTIKKQFANDDLASFIELQAKNLPHSFALEALARYEGNTVKIGSGDTANLLELTDFQRRLWDGLKNNNDLISFASPTSSGKTYLLLQFLTNSAILANDKFIAIYLVPTRALITEITYSLRSLLSSENIEDVEVLSVGGDLDKPIPSKVIYVFTQERLLSFLANIMPGHLSRINYVVIDEAHQIRERARGTLLHQSLNWLKLSYQVSKFVFCSPVISNPDLFGKLLTHGDYFVAESHITESSPVSQNLMIVESVKGRRNELSVTYHDGSGSRYLLSDNIKLDKKRSDDTKAYFLAYCSYYLGGGKRNIVYVDDPSTADRVAKKLMSIIEDVSDDPEILDASDYMARNIHPDFVLSKSIKKKVGVHYGKMPSLVRETVERLFRDEKLDFIVCTSTLAQGVNLPAHNLFILDPKVRDSDTNAFDSISRSDFWNIVGRAGRLYKDFEGNVFLLKQPSKNEDWEEQYLSESRLSDIVPSTQQILLEQHADLIEHISNAGKDAKKGIEEAASFIYDISRSGRSLDFSLSWIPSLEAEVLSELKRETDEVESRVTLPHGVIKKNVGVSPVRQQALYDFLLSQLILDDWLLPRKFSSALEFHRIVYIILRFLDSPEMEDERLKKYTWLFVGPAFDWVLGKPLSSMVGEHIKWWKRKKELFELDSNNINSCIRDLFDQVENKVRFKLVKYINCYNNIILEVCHQKERPDLMERVPVYLPLFLEVGASNPLQIGLISLGLSRMTALEISKYIEIDSYDGDPARLRRIVKDLSKRNKKIPLLCREEIDHYII